MGNNQNNLLVKTLIENYKPFHPQENNLVQAWAYYIPDALDEDEKRRDGNCLFYFEIFTDSQIEYIDRNFASSDYIPASYSFTAILSEKNDKEIIQQLKDYFTPGEFKRITIANTLAGFLGNDKSISGKLNFAYCPAKKYRERDDLLNSCEACIKWSAAVSSRLSEDEALKIIRNLVDNYKNGRYISDIGETGEGGSGGSGDRGGNGGSGSSGSPFPKVRIRIYNVGGANMAYAEYSNGESLLIDCGCDTFYPHNYVKSIVHLVDHIRPTAIVISHWHLDHYMLLPTVNKSKLKYIIIPTWTGASPNMMNVLRAWEISSGSKIIDLSKMSTQYNDFLSKNGFAKTYIYLGQGHIPNRNNEVPKPSIGNETAIIIRIGDDSSHKRVILPSDVSYHNWPDNCGLSLKNFTRVIVPHHGGNVYTRKVDASDLHKLRSGVIYVSTNFSSVKPLHNQYLQKVMDSYGPDYHFTHAFNSKCFQEVNWFIL